jgi:hypothetical protein
VTFAFALARPFYPFLPVLSLVSKSSGNSCRMTLAKALKAFTSSVTKAVAMLRRGRVEVQLAPQWIKFALANLGHRRLALKRKYQNVQHQYIN